MIPEVYPEVPCLLAERATPAILAAESVVEVVFHHIGARGVPTESPRDVVKE